MYIGGPSEHVQTYVTTSGRSGGAVAASHAPTGDVANSDVAPFISPVMNFNYEAGIAVLEFRDTSTGEVKDQFPSKKAVQEYIRHGAVSQDSAPAPQTAASGPAAPDVPAPVVTAPAAPVAAPAAPVVAAAPTSHTA